MSTQSTAAGPLSSVRVLELTTAWAGPFAGRSLAYLGADVIKVEAPGHPDAWRGPASGGAPRYYPELDPRGRPQDSNVLFNSQNLDKRSMALDLKSDDGLRIFRDLARGADIVLANYTCGVLDRLGIGYDDLQDVNPGLSVVEMPAFSARSPMSGHQGMGKTMEPATGMTALMGYGDGVPVLTGPAIMDPIGGLHAVAATVTALEHRERTGRGCRIEVGQVEAATHWIGEFLLEEEATGSSWQPEGNHAAGRAPNEAFPCLGEDQWVVISVETEGQWRALCHESGLQGLLGDPRFATPAARWRHQSELEPHLARWTEQQDKRRLAQRLQALGVPAAPVLDGEDIALDPATHAAGLVVELDHPVVGRRSYSTLAFRHSRTPGSHTVAAPTFGQHTEQILREDLGCSQEEIARLRDQEVITDRPVARTDARHREPHPTTTQGVPGDGGR